MNKPERYAAIEARLAALERLILQPARTGRGGTQPRYKKHNPKRQPPRNRMDAL